MTRPAFLPDYHHLSHWLLQGEASEWKIPSGYALFASQFPNDCDSRWTHRSPNTTALQPISNTIANSLVRDTT